MSAHPFNLEPVKAVADKAIGETVIPKKIPAVDDVEGQTKMLVGALSSALLNLAASEMPLSIPPPVIGQIAAQLVTFGVRQTEHYDPAALRGPAWITDGVKQQSMPVPDPPRHTAAAPMVEMTGTAPEPPAAITAGERAVRR